MYHMTKSLTTFQYCQNFDFLYTAYNELKWIFNLASGSN